MKTRSLMSCASMLLAAALPSAWADTVKIAVIDPASGPFAGPSLNWTRSMKLTADAVNRNKLAGGHTLELTQFDNKGTAQESVAVFRTAVDQGYRYFINGGSSAAYATLLDAVNKHNARNPGKEVLLLTHSNSDPDLTNAKCAGFFYPGECINARGFAAAMCCHFKT